MGQKKHPVYEDDGELILLGDVVTIEVSYKPWAEVEHTIDEIRWNDYVGEVWMASYKVRGLVVTPNMIRTHRRAQEG